MFAAHGLLTFDVKTVVYKDSAAAAATSVTIPSHNPGDMIVLWAFNNGSTLNYPAKPSASGTVPTWTDITSRASNSSYQYSAYCIATTSSTTTGTWTYATGIVVAVFSNAKYIGGYAATGGNSSTPTCPAITLQNANGSSAICQFYGQRNVTSWGAAAAGYTRRASESTSVAMDTKDDTKTDGSVSITGGTGGYQTMTVELRS